MFKVAKWQVLKINKRKQVRFDLIDFQNNLEFKIMFKSENLKFWHDLFVYSPRDNIHEVARITEKDIHGNQARI